MLGKYDCPEFNTLVKGKPRFIVNPKKFDKNDPSKGIHVRLKTGYQCPAEHHHISRLRQATSDYLLNRYRVLNESQITRLIKSLNKHCNKADNRIRIIEKSTKLSLNLHDFKKAYPEQFRHILEISEARDRIILQYKSVTNSKDIESLLVKPIKFKIRYTTEELLVILGTMIQKDVLQVLELERRISKKELCKLLADYVGIVPKKTDRSIDWKTIETPHVASYERQNVYRDHFNQDFSVEFDELWADDDTDIGILLKALIKFSPTKKGD
jgi:hypothetical protein